MADAINVISRTQNIVVDRGAGAVAIINAGPTGPAGPPGPPGASYSLWEYNYATGTAPPPSAGTFRSDGTYLTSTLIWVHSLDIASSDRTAMLMMGKKGATLYIQDVNDATQHWVYNLTADAVDSGAYITFAVAFKEGGGSLIGNMRALLGVAVPAPQGPPGDWSSPRTIETITTTSYTLESDDPGKIKRVAAISTTVTLPSSVFSAGQSVDFLCVTGKATFVLGAGATWDVAPSPSNVARAIGSLVRVIKMGPIAWALSGDLEGT